VQGRGKRKCKVYYVMELDDYVLQKLRSGDFKISVEMYEGRR
jgi:hypothetical protein